MRRWSRLVGLVLASSGCGKTGDWVVETWGEDYIEQGLPASIFADGCAVTYDTFLVSMAQRQLRDGDGGVVGELLPAEVYDLTVPGPSPMGSVAVPADHYSDVQLTVAPDATAVAGTASTDDTAELIDAGGSVLADGVLTCPSGEAHFRWVFEASTTYGCEPADLTIPAGGSDDTQLTIHGDHLWYDGLENADAEVRGEAVLAADADADGEVTLAELEAVSIPALGYQVGQFSNVLDLRSFVAHLSQTIAHVDGEGECRVSTY